MLRGVQLTGFLDGMNITPAEKMKIKEQKGTDQEIKEMLNPAFEAWKAQEQQVLSYLLCDRTTSKMRGFVSQDHIG
jgi:hypothetical protein